MRSLDETMPLACRRIHMLAERDPRRAVLLARRAVARVPEADLVDHAWGRYVLGWSLLCWERFDAAGVPREALRCRLYRAVLFNILGRTHDAEIVLAAIDQSSVAAGPLDRARWLRVASVAAIVRGDSAQAVDRLQQAEAIFATAH